MRGLTIKRSRRPSLHQVGLVTVSLALVVGAGWMGYRWYFFGDDLPVSIAQTSADPRVDETPVSKEQVATHRVPADQPRYISVPALGVASTRVFAVGTEANGQLTAPDKLDDTAWYKKSATPGLGYGAVLISGHNGGVSRNGVFAGLSQLEIGDEIVIERGDGSRFRYEVRENRSMPLKEVNQTGMQMMLKSADESKEGLNLITCDGKWVPRLQQYDRRIMLRAVLTSSTPAA